MRRLILGGRIILGSQTVKMLETPLSLNIDLPRSVFGRQGLGEWGSDLICGSEQIVLLNKCQFSASTNHVMIKANMIRVCRTLKILFANNTICMVW
jgi:hypothetical protein